MVQRAESQGRLATREEAAGTARHWVRLTSCCNNRCLFCLDAEAQDGRSRRERIVLEEIQRGVRLGRKRLVLSGGEPTIHKSFLDFIRAGRDAGYERVQVITNGRMFARGDLLEQAIDAGLGEVTISLHGHNAALHDELVGVEGAFAQTLRALAAARRQPELIVNVDIVVCRPNVDHVPKIIELCRRLGIHEFDLLQVQPFGRAAEEGRDVVLYDPADKHEALQQIFGLSQQDNLFLWTNRFPLRELEGFEELIQDPHKLIDEVRGRYEHMERLFAEGAQLRCHGPHCAACFLQPLCESLHSMAGRVRAHAFTELLIDIRQDEHDFVAIESESRFHRVRVLARDFAQVQAMLRVFPIPADEIALILESVEGFDRRELGDGLTLGGIPVTRLGGESPAVLNAALSLEVDEIEVIPSLASEDWLSLHATIDRPRLVVRPAPRATATECLEQEIPPDRLAALLSESRALVEDIPSCLAGWRPNSWTEQPLLPELLGKMTPERLEAIVEKYAAERYRARSARCDDCVDSETCQGAHVQRLRAFGMSILKPRG